MRARGFVPPLRGWFFLETRSEGFTLHPSDKDPSLGAPAWAIFNASRWEADGE